MKLGERWWKGAWRRRASVLLAALLLLPGYAACTTPVVDDPRELARTWRHALLRIPGSAFGGGGVELVGRLDEDAVQQRLREIAPGLRLPAVILMHGCKGFNRASARYGEILVALGFAVIMPDSFARKDRPETCDPKRKQGIPGAPIRRVMGMRIAEIRYAAAQARALPWLDAGRLYLMGHSQGGFAAAVYPGGEFRGRILSGTSCPRGIAAPPGEPVLTLSSQEDPWLRGRIGGTCARWLGTRGNLTVRVFPGRRHDLSGDAEAGEAIRRFLAQPAPR